jgi:hypothetical protein
MAADSNPYTSVHADDTAGVQARPRRCSSRLTRNTIRCALRCCGAPLASPGGRRGGMSSNRSTGPPMIIAKDSPPIVSQASLQPNFSPVLHREPREFVGPGALADIAGCAALPGGKPPDLSRRAGRLGRSRDGVRGRSLQRSDRRGAASAGAAVVALAEGPARPEELCGNRPSFISGYPCGRVASVTKIDSSHGRIPGIQAGSE